MTMPEAVTDFAAEMLKLARDARTAARTLATLSPEIKNAALQYCVEALIKERSAIETANAEDLARGREKGLSGPMLDRLKLDTRGIEKLAEGIQQVIALPDPVGQEISRSVRPSGLVLRRVR